MLRAGNDGDGQDKPAKTEFFRTNPGLIFPARVATRLRKKDDRKRHQHRL
jgi:hypothetical protein